MPLSEAEELRWRKLNALDAKTSALLRLCSILMSVISVSIFYGSLQPWMLPWIRVLFVCLVISSALCVTVLWVTWRITDRLVTIRTWCCRLALIFTAAGLFCLAYLIAKVQLVSH